MEITKYTQASGGRSHVLYVKEETSGELYAVGNFLKVYKLLSSA